MSVSLPPSVAAYIAGSNAHDPDACAACFASDAVVIDEKRERKGSADIRAWKDEVTKKYHPILDVLKSENSGGRTIVTGRVSGNFPGSPVELSYAFTLKDDKIARLEIV
jgi:hypothetical protein